MMPEAARPPSPPPTVVGANQPIHWFIGGKDLGIQQGTNVSVGLPKSPCNTIMVRLGILV